VRGRTLHSVLEQARRQGRGWPAPLQAFQAYRHLAHALGQLHNVTLCVHGDLKPAHLVLVRERMVLVDFGSAWTQERTAARVAGDGFTACYASPEQHRGAAVVDFRSDHFSAAVIAYELLTRQVPYDGVGGRAGRGDLAAAFAGKLIPPSRLAANPEGLPREAWQRLDRVIVRALALDPGQRFATRKACLDELDAIDAFLKLRPQLHPVHEAILTGIDRVAAWLSRRSDPRP
jgi:hypothetical protein